MERIKGAFAAAWRVIKGAFRRREKSANIVLSVAVTAVKIAGIVLLTASVSMAGAALGVAKAYYDTVPEINIERFDEQDQSSFIYDINGVLLTSYKGSENRVWADYDELPQRLIDAFVAVEDVRFYSHKGVDFKRLMGAFVNNMLNETVQGGSTITQQLIKNRLLTMEQTYKRKIQEAYMALELETEYPKDQILEWYLNTILMGGSNYGVKAAAMDYFGKDLDQLTLRECAVLAGMNRNPSRYNPRSNYYTRNTPEVTDDRTDYVLRTMYENGFIDQATFNAAMAEQTAVAEKTNTNTNKLLYDMPYAVESVLYDVETAILKARNQQATKESRAAVRSEVQRRGYRIYSTIDPELQRIAEQTVYEWEKYPKLGANASSVVRDIGSNGIITETVQPQAAVAVIDYSVGEVRAIVGGRFAPTQLLQMNRARQSHMPVGSSIKPLTIYGPALDKGLSPATPVINLPVPIPGYGGTKGYPSNFSSSASSGIVSMRTAITKSLNTVAAQVLYTHVGLNDSKNYLTSLGAEPDYINTDGPGLALGTSGVTPLQMASAFGAIANKGQYMPPLTFTHITDSSGNIILDQRQTQVRDTRQVFMPSTAWMLTDMLTDAVNKGTGTNARIKGMTVAGKTGTSSDYKGVFFAGFTPYYSAAVWVGHDHNQALYDGATGGSDAAPLFQAVMQNIHEALELEDKPIIEDSPESLGLIKGTVCAVSGKLATALCLEDKGYSTNTDWFLASTLPTELCDVHMSLSVCSASDMLAGVYCPAEMVVTRSAAMLHADHPAALMDRATLIKYLPGVFVDHSVSITDALEAPQEGALLLNSAYKYGYVNYCTLHTASYVPVPTVTNTPNETEDGRLSSGGAEVGDSTNGAGGSDE